MTRPFKQHPTLDDLQAFAAEQDELHARLRAAWRKSLDTCIAGRNLDARVAQSVVRKFKRTENVGDGRDLRTHQDASRQAQKAKGLYQQAAEAEREATELNRLIEESRAGRQMEAEDYDLYLSRGLELPTHRRAMYQANARREAAQEHADELLDACDEMLVFTDDLIKMMDAPPIPDAIQKLRAVIGKINMAVPARDAGTCA
jgi:hypothetical protein